MNSIASLIFYAAIVLTLFHKHPLAANGQLVELLTIPPPQTNVIPLTNISSSTTNYLPEINLNESANYITSDGNMLVNPTGSSEDISYFLYTKQHPLEPVPITVGDSSGLKASGFIPGAPVKILTHGWMGAYNTSFPQDMKNAYLANFTEGNLNVITTDWSPLSKNANYFAAASNVPLVAKCTFRLISFLLQSNLTKVCDIHLVGHSLGAHISGITGQSVQQKLNLTLPRISGLDPAKPLFGLLPRDQRIDHTDANFVDIIHTTGLTVGIFRTLGHVDFYPNGGVTQEGCNLNPGCSHSRAHEYFTESITHPKAFTACPCPRTDLPPTTINSTDEYMPLLTDCHCSATNEIVHMGQYVSNKTMGVFCLRTNSGSPYSRSV